MFPLSFASAVKPFFHSFDLFFGLALIFLTPAKQLHATIISILSRYIEHLPFFSVKTFFHEFHQVIRQSMRKNNKNNYPTLFYRDQVSKNVK